MFNKCACTCHATALRPRAPDADRGTGRGVTFRRAWSLPDTEVRRHVSSSFILPSRSCSPFAQEVALFARCVRSPVSYLSARSTVSAICCCLLEETLITKAGGQAKGAKRHTGRPQSFDYHRTLPVRPKGHESTPVARSPAASPSREVTLQTRSLVNASSALS